jgi:hypothetical protein
VAGEERVFSEFEEEEAVAEEDITTAVVVWGYMFTKAVLIAILFTHFIALYSPYFFFTFFLTH